MNDYRGLSRELVEKISTRKNDPKWMRELRLRSLKIFEQMPMPSFGPNLDDLKISDIASYVENSSAMVSDWSEVPEEIRRSFDELGIPQAERESLAGVGAQYDSELVYHNIKQAVADQGVVYLGIEEALHDEKYADILRAHFMKLITAKDHKFAALHGAVWSGGSFVYVPKNTRVSLPLQSYYRFNAPGAGQFEHTLIIVDDGADLDFIEGCSAPKYNVANLHAGCVEIFVGKNAHVKYSTVENWSKNMYNLNSKRAIVSEGGRMEWVTGSFGSHISMLYPMTILAGSNASMEYVGVSLASEDQNLDTGVKVFFDAPNTSAHMVSKSISRKNGRNTFRSLVKVSPRAKNAKSFLDCESLMLNNEAFSDTIPVYDIQSSDASISHESKVGKISQEKIDFLATRGICEADAEGLIMRGFMNEVSRELPLEYAAEMNNLIRMEIQK